MGKKRKPIKQIERTDLKVSAAASDHRSSAPVKALSLFGKLSDQPPLYAFAAGLAAAALIRRDGALLRTSIRAALAHGAAAWAKDRVKNAVDRTRPIMAIEQGRYSSGKGRHDTKAFSSFPSGHTAGAVAIARALSREHPEAAIPAYGLAGATALARVAECDHFVSDTLAGAAIGWAAEALVAWAEAAATGNRPQG